MDAQELEQKAIGNGELQGVITEIMLPINLHDLLHQRTIESERIEYKVGWNPESILYRFSISIQKRGNS